jgi:tetratricopeptide (TPR) repeat protein
MAFRPEWQLGSIPFSKNFPIKKSAEMAEQLDELTQLLSELGTAGPGGSVEVLLRQMEPERARHLRLCAIPHEFNHKILRALAPDLSEEQARARCEQFSTLSTIAACNDVLVMHEESRRHLFERWLDPERASEFAAASRRMVDYFDTQLAQFRNERIAEKSDAGENVGRNRMFHLIGASRPDGMAEFERLCRRKREQFRLGECETLIKLVHEYDLALNTLEHAIVTYHEGKLAADRHQWSVAEGLYNRVIATDEIPIQLRVKTLCRLGMIQDEQRHWKEAISLFEKGLAVADARPDCKQQIIHLHLNLGSSYRDRGDLKKADMLLHEGISLANDAHYFSGVADGYNTLGTLFQKWGDTESAIKAFETSLTYLDQTRDDLRRAQINNNLGNIYADAGNWKKSEELYRQSLETKRRAGDNSGQAKTLTNLIRVYRSQQQPQKAIEAAVQAAELFGQIRDDYEVAKVKRSLGRIHQSMGSNDLARAALNEAADLFERCKEKRDAKASRKEARSIGRKSRVWWVVAAIVVCLLIIILLIALA